MDYLAGNVQLVIAIFVLKNSFPTNKTIKEGLIGQKVCVKTLITLDIY